EYGYLRSGALRCAPSRNGRADPAPHGSAGAVQVPIEPDARGAADQVLLGHEAPTATVVTVAAVVAHHEVHARRHHPVKGRHADGPRGVLVAAYEGVHGRAAAVAGGERRPAVDRHRAEHRLVLVLAQALVRQGEVLVAAVVVVLLGELKLHRLTVDGDAV